MNLQSRAAHPKCTITRTTSQINFDQQVCTVSRLMLPIVTDKENYCFTYDKMFDDTVQKKSNYTYIIKKKHNCSYRITLYHIGLRPAPHANSRDLIRLS